MEKMNDKIQLESNIPSEMCKIICEQAANNEHYDKVFRVAKWGQNSDRTFLSTYSEIENKYIPDNEERYPKDNIGTYSTSVYTEVKPCDKFIKSLRKKTLKKLYPNPLILVGTTSKGLVQRTIDRELDYSDPTHIDWWIYRGKMQEVAKDFKVYE